MKKTSCIAVFLSLAVFVCSVASADFYVIGAGPRAKRTVLVSPKTTPETSGSELLAAISRITDADWDKRYLLKIEPGIFDIGTASLIMKPFVDIEGSGELATTIRGHMDADTTGVVVGSDNAELRFLTVEHASDGSYGIAIYNASASPRITHVTATASNCSVACWGILNVGASPRITNSRIQASSPAATRALSNVAGSCPEIVDVVIEANGAGMNRAIHNTGSGTSPLITNVRATASGGTSAIAVTNSNYCSPVLTNVTATGKDASAFNIGIDTELGAWLTISHSVLRGFNGPEAYGLYIYNQGSEVEARNSLFSGVNNSIRNDTTADIYLGACQLKGAPVSGGTLHCAVCYDMNYTALNGSCQ